MDKNQSILLGIFLGTLIVILAVFSNYSDESMLSLSAIVVGIFIGYFIENKPQKYSAIAIIIQQIIGYGILFSIDHDLKVVLSYGVISGLLFVVLIFKILFNLLLGILASFISSTVRKYRR